MFGSPFAKPQAWVEANVPDLSGKTYIITGANSGIGLEAARILASKNAKVVLACRSEPKARQAIEDLVNGVSEISYKATPSPFKVSKENVDFLQLDLADLASIEKFSQEVLEKYPKVDGLILNAGIMAPNQRGETAQGFEAQMGTNVFGHFALATRLVPALANAISEGAAPPHMVWLSSGAHKMTKTIDFDDMDHKNKYSKWQIYAESKLGDLLLMHKFADLYPQFIVNGCHPGYSATNLQDDTVFEHFNKLFAQSALAGSLPTVMAAVDPSAKSKEYFGPYWDAWGLPDRASMTSTAEDPALAEKLFEVCVARTGVSPAPL